jgi:hypothetical protein
MSSIRRAPHEYENRLSQGPHARARPITVVNLQQKAVNQTRQDRRHKNPSPPPTEREMMALTSGWGGQQQRSRGSRYGGRRPRWMPWRRRRGRGLVCEAWREVVRRWEMGRKRNQMVMMTVVGPQAGGSGWVVHGCTARCGGTGEWSPWPGWGGRVVGCVGCNQRIHVKWISPIKIH